MTPEILELAFTKLPPEKREAIKSLGVWDFMTEQDIQDFSLMTVEEISRSVEFAQSRRHLLFEELKTSPYQWTVRDTLKVSALLIAGLLFAPLIALKIHLLTVISVMVSLCVIGGLLYILYDKYCLPEYDTNEEIRKGNVAVAVKAGFTLLFIGGMAAVGYMFISNVSGDPNSENNKGDDTRPITIQFMADTNKVKPDTIGQRPSSPKLPTKRNSGSPQREQ